MKRISFLISIIIMLSLHIQLRGQTTKLPPNCNAPAPTQFLALSNPCDGFVYTSWEKVPNNNGYTIKIYKKGDGKVFLEKKVEKNAVKAKIGGLKPNTDYIAKISTNCSATKTSTKLATYNFSTKKSNLPPVKNVKVDGTTVTWDKVKNSKGYLVLVYKNEKYEPLFCKDTLVVVPANLTPCKISVAAIDNLGRVYNDRIICPGGIIIVTDLVVMDPEPPTPKDTLGMTNNENLRVSSGDTDFRGLISGETKRYKLVINNQDTLYIKITKNNSMFKISRFANSNILSQLIIDDGYNSITWSNYKIQFSNLKIEVLERDGNPPLFPYSIYQSQ